MLEHVSWGVDSREQETLEAKARGEHVRRVFEIAGKKQGLSFFKTGRKKSLRL